MTLRARLLLPMGAVLVPTAALFVWIVAATYSRETESAQQRLRETTRALAMVVDREPWGQRMILVALTGWGQDEDRRRAVAAGFDHHLTKPADPERLRPVLDAAVAAHKAASESHSARG